MKMTLYLLAGLATIWLTVTGSHASGEIYCKATDGRSGTIAMVVGRLPVLQVLSAQIAAFGKTWSTAPGSENLVIVGQAFEDKGQMLVDLTDPNVESVVISLRTLRVSTVDEYGEAGILRIGNAVYPVICES